MTMHLETEQRDFFIEDQLTSNIDIRTGSAIDIDPLDATFRDSGRAPLHSWFPYLEGYSPRFVEGVRMEYLPNARRILEPFAGSGTTPIVLGQAGIECAYSEANPAMAFIIRTKLEILSMGFEERRHLSERLSVLNRHLNDRTRSANINKELRSSYITTFGNSVFFDELTLENILRLRTLNDNIDAEDKVLGKCFTLAIMASLIPSSRLKRSGDLRFRTPKELLSGIPCILDLVSERLLTQSTDIASATEMRTAAHFACDTAGGLRQAVDGMWDGVITSPPYLNGTNYIRNARLELWYHRCIRSKGDIRRLRDGVITSGINDVDARTDWRPVVKGVERVVCELERNAYDQRIAKMVGGYFRDMHVTLAKLSDCLKVGGRMCIDIGDSIYAGIHVPTDDLLIEVAESLELRTIERVHLRKRTSKGGQPVRQQLLVFEK